MHLIKIKKLAANYQPIRFSFKEYNFPGSPPFFGRGAFLQHNIDICS
ncbi:hypothetical protein MOMUL_28500 [Moorella mulderi DSM 14980]|uniref:Uncharacterized protein n=1 Tax=Moorella mulderi DSM 14980 TaxID=1122241 RepID=A0A151ATA6_9FIRM|nr:hypothetical protein MOMUL_28500 [Moorella mulderi DSM 14980]